MSTTKAPPIDCAACGRRIGKRAGHVLLGYPDDLAVDKVICLGCMMNHTSTRLLHARFYPNCEHDWHDLWDHQHCGATRAAAAHLLGIWP
jgi:hypothetical protein